MRKSIALLMVGMGLAGAAIAAGCDPNPNGPSAPSLPKDVGQGPDAAKKEPPALPLQ